MIILSRAQIHKNEGIDTTVRANIPFISPDWEHVLKFKSKQIIEEQYRIWYVNRLASNSQFVHDWAKNFNKDELVFLCYCRDTEFCHTHLLIDFLITKWPTEFKRS